MLPMMSLLNVTMHLFHPLKEAGLMPARLFEMWLQFRMKQNQAFSSKKIVNNANLQQHHRFCFKNCSR
jgi:hypothetical protein